MKKKKEEEKENNCCSKCRKEKIFSSKGIGWSKTTKFVCPDGHE